MNPTTTPARPGALLVSKIIEAAGKDSLTAYIEQIFAPELVAIGYYTEENAESWPSGSEILQNPTNFPCYLTTSHHTFPSPHGILSHSSSPVPQSRRLPPLSLTAELDSDDDDAPVALVLASSKRKRQLDLNPDSDSDCVVLPAAKKGKRRKSAGKADGGMEMQEITITKQFRVPEIREVTKLQSSWDIPRTEIGEGFAYRLNLTSDERGWIDPKNEPLSMAAIIKSEDQDSWAGGSAGSIVKATKVAALDGVLCQVAFHNCQGVYVCSELDMSLLDGHERYEADDDEMRELFEAEREVNVRETSSVAIQAAAFYKEIHTKKCPHVDATGLQCTGIPVYRKLREMNLDGKHGFIGCQNYRAGDSRTHRFTTIQRNVKEDYICELLSNDGVFTSNVGLDPQSAVCARVLPPRSGGKGDRLCPYTHINENRQVIQGKIIHRPCNAKIRIFSPLERSDHRAIIHLTGPHNHPKFPSRKISCEGRDAYREAIITAGVTGLTVLKCDSAESTSKLFGGQIPAGLDPTLANPRIKRKLILDVKKISSPYGLGIEGVLAWQKQMRSLPHEKQYVWKVTSENGEEIVITMLPYLADHIHRAKASLHDNTYARVHGTWKEWEVVIWDHKFDFRVTIGRIYSQHEKYDVFMKMWPGLWETIAHITKTEVKFKFIDGEGLQAILVDGNKPQANALGAYLVTRNRPYLSGVHETDPKLILPKILRTCIFHVHRKFAEMAKVVPDQPMARIRRSPYIKTQAEMDDFVCWCKESEYKVVRDWISDKDSIPWFFPSINEFLSDMPEEDWYLTPGDTNLNESAHPYTNQHTGTNLSLLEAIQRAAALPPVNTAPQYSVNLSSQTLWLDLQMEAKLRAMEDTCVLVNHLNTKPHRDRKNDSRRTSNFRQAQDRSEARGELENLEDALQRSTACTREIREQKKTLKSTSGVKKTKRQGEKEKERFPDEDEFTGLANFDSSATRSRSPSIPHLRPALHFPTQDDFQESNPNFQLDSSLEPSFPSQQVFDEPLVMGLSGDPEDYLPYAS
ncbi:hypothetical protein DFH09DRAFT_1343071 [Mycena vulgaris]|nr:hypothetical protein DFH09DRAFT_1343071 [Mycena vulgaris]